MVKKDGLTVDDDLNASLARSLEMSIDMLPFVPDLLKGMWALGSSPELVVDLLRPLRLDSARTRVLDLGCGKGAVSVILAEELGFRVLGVDICEDFLIEAAEKAVEYGVSDRCRFEFHDMRRFVRTASGFDVVILASLGSVLGAYEPCVAALRKTVRPGGFMLIDDGFLKGSEPVTRAGYDHYVPHDLTLSQLTAHGDRLLKEVLTVEENRAINREYLEIIKQNARDLVARTPGIAVRVEEYIRNQEIECDTLDKYVTGAIWLLQREERSSAGK